MDLEFKETGNGGSVRMAGNDLAVVTGVENMPYLAMFGGNDWWGNNLLLSGSRDFQFSAETEALLLTVPLNSGGRIIIENAIKRDLQFLVNDIPGTVLNVVTRITDDNRLEILITGEGINYYQVWNPSEVQKATTGTPGGFVTEDQTQFFETEDGSEIFVPE